MGGSVIFYTYGSTLELNGQQLTAGMLTADLLNLSPDEYMRLKKRMTQITDLAEEYERKRDIALWWKLNEKMEFPIVKDTTPNMMNPRLYTTSYNKPQGQQFDDTAVLSFIKLQYT